MAVNPKPRFGSAVLWGACSRCGARVKYSTLARERLTGLLVCTKASGRPVNPCLDPWPEVYDFQLSPDRSIDPPPEPLPLRYNLDNIWGNGPAHGTTKEMAAAPRPAPDDATRLGNLLLSVPYYAQQGKTAAFNFQGSLAVEIVNAVKIQPAGYDGTFLPSSSMRTVTPPDEAGELAATNQTDVDILNDPLAGPPWAQVKQV